MYEHGVRGRGKASILFCVSPNRLRGGGGDAAAAAAAWS